MDKMSKDIACEKLSRQLEEVEEAMNASIIKPLNEDVSLIHHAYNDESGWAFAEKYSRMISQISKLCDEISYQREQLNSFCKKVNLTKTGE